MNSYATNPGSRPMSSAKPSSTRRVSSSIGPLRNRYLRMLANNSPPFVRVPMPPAVGVSASRVGRLEQFAARSADQQLAPQRHSALEAEILQLLGDEPRREFVGLLRHAVVADEADPQDLVVTAGEHVPRFEALHGLESVGEAVVDPVHELAD